MRKIMLLCSVALLSACSSVGLASNAAKNEKQPMVLDDPFYGVPPNIDLIKEFNPIEESDLIFIVDSRTADLNHMAIFMAEELKIEAKTLLITPPVAVLANPVTVPDLECDYLAFKETKRFKNKYHAEHLFNPVKLC